MVTLVKDVLSAAVKEWDFWGNSTWNLVTHKRHISHRDDEHEFAQYVIDQYCSIAGGTPSVTEIQNDEYPWSAVGLSAFMHNAGILKSQFPFSQSHSTYIRKLIKARQINDQSALYWGFRLGENGGQPEVGDLVAYARGPGLTPEKASKYFDKTSSYTSHADLVVARRDGEIDVIGANVMDSVTMKTLSLNKKGHLSDGLHHWFATLKYRGS